jgi:hypothetical protein
LLRPRSWLWIHFIPRDARYGAGRQP